MNMTHTGRGLGREATQNTMANKCSYTEEKKTKQLYSKSQGRNKVAICEEPNPGLEWLLCCNKLGNLGLHLVGIQSSYLSYLCITR